MTLDFAILFGALLAGHALCDGPLQPPALSLAKRRTPWALFAHAGLHGLAVALLTGMPLLGFLETGVHAATDDAKRRGYFGMVVDQAIHVACKAVWAALAIPL